MLYARSGFFFQHRTPTEGNGNLKGEEEGDFRVWRIERVKLIEGRRGV